MSKGKSVFITAVMALMLTVIIAGLAMIESKGYILLTTMLAVYGFLRAAMDLCGWMQKEPTEPQHLNDGDMWQHDDEFADSMRGG